MRLKNERYEEIKRSVVNAFIKYDIHCVPISGFEMASKMGSVVVPYSSKPPKVRTMMMKQSEDGFVVLKNGRWFIFYNDEKGYGRVNHTLLHECGHIELGHTEHSRLAETEANFFAKYAIAPPVLIHKLNLKSPGDIYMCFDISMQVADYAFAYYQKWLAYGKNQYTDYERRIINLFNEAS